MKLIDELLKKTLEVFLEIRGREAVFAEGYCRIEKYSETEVIRPTHVVRHASANIAASIIAPNSPNS